MAKSSSRSARSAPSGVKIPVYALLIVAAVLIAAYVWISYESNKPTPPPSWSDQDAGTTPIEGPLEALRRAWNLSNLEAVLALTMHDEVESDDDTDTRTDEPTRVERRIEQNGWAGDLPKMGEPEAERTDATRYTVKWPLSAPTTEGASDAAPVPPIVTFWEWDGKRWLIANWQIAPTNR